MKPRCLAIQVHPEITLYHYGPPLELGPLPAFFYLALSGEDSLCKDPFNQPIQFLPTDRIRAFSMTLPGHENNLPPTGALKIWAEDYEKHQHPIDTFLNGLIQAVDFVIEKKFVKREQLAIGGLSRGGFMALHAAARDERFQKVVAFAPITDLSAIQEFRHLKENPIIQSLHTNHLAPALIHRELKIFIGNLDTRVGTESCVHFAMNLILTAKKEKIRSPRMSLSLFPSIGHQGHGTPPEIFKEGADWVAECLK